MENYYIYLIFLGLCLDGFIVMMKKGATIKDLSFAKMLIYSLIFSVVSILAVILGYMCATIFVNTPIKNLNELASVLVLFGLGIIFVARALFNQGFLETLDNSFTLSKCWSLALLSNIDTLLVGFSLSLIDVNILLQIILSLIFSFISVFTSLKIGYTYGLRFSRFIQTVGGVILTILSVVIAFRFIIV